MTALAGALIPGAIRAAAAKPSPAALFCAVPACQLEQTKDEIPWYLWARS